MSIPMKHLHFPDGGTYSVGVDDGCLVIAPGEDEDAPRVWISPAMAQWIGAQKPQPMGVRRFVVETLDFSPDKLPARGD